MSRTVRSSTKPPVISISGATPSMHVDGALVGQDDAGDELEQGRLALAVAADDADRLAALHGERHVAQRPELAGPGAAVAAGEEVLEAAAAAPVAAEPDADVASAAMTGRRSSDLLQHGALGAAEDEEADAEEGHAT